MSTYSNSLFISNPSSTGQAGVTVELFRALAWEAHWLPLDPADSLPVGAYVQSEVFGTAGSVSNGLLGSWRETKVGTSNYVVSADFSPLGATTVTLQVYDGTKLVAATNGQSGDLCRIYGCVDDDHWGHPVPNGGPFGGGLTMFGPTEIAFPGGWTAWGDRLVILPEGAPPVSSLSAVTILAGQIPQIVITNERVREIEVPLWVKIGRRSFGCQRFGLCIIDIDVPTDPADSARSIPAVATWIHGRLQLDFLAEPPDKTNVLTIDQDIVLSSATAQALGHQQVTVHAGTYPVDYTVNPHGQVSPDVTVQGFVIGGTFTIGRNRYSCRRFGICTVDEITIDFDLSSDSRTIPGGMTWVNGGLVLNFLAEPPDKTNVLVIDDDIELNPVLAQALGQEHVTIRAGQYPMDYSVNPHGQFSPDIGTILLKIHQSPDGTVAITWPVSATAFSLVETADFLGSASTWTPVTNTPTASNGTYQVTLPPQHPRRFYRLETMH